MKGRLFLLCCWVLVGSLVFGLDSMDLHGHMGVEKPCMYSAVCEN